MVLLQSKILHAVVIDYQSLTVTEVPQIMDPFPLMDGHPLLTAILEAVHESNVLLAVVDDHQQTTIPCDQYAGAHAVGGSPQLLMTLEVILETVYS